jgi:hypothetical protein
VPCRPSGSLISEPLHSWGVSGEGNFAHFVPPDERPRFGGASLLPLSLKEKPRRRATLGGARARRQVRRVRRSSACNERKVTLTQRP